jgi:cell fate (sporulation/competence/biofilm development) regulator YmcA (YheA/YmcA/DUF963 family)
MSDIHNLIDELAFKLKSSDDYNKLLEAEEKMKNDEEVNKLSIEFQKAELAYSNGLNHYKEGSKELSDLQRDLYFAKYALDINPLVKEYTTLLNKVNEPLKYLQFNLIDLFKGHKGTCK